MFWTRPQSNEDISAVLVNKNHVVIDVRTADEFQEGHINGALNISHDVIIDQIGKHVQDKSTPLVLYCHSGGRSNFAKGLLEANGFETVVDAGGYLAFRRFLDQS